MEFIIYFTYDKSSVTPTIVTVFLEVSVLNVIRRANTWKSGMCIFTQCSLIRVDFKLKRCMLNKIKIKN